MSLAIGAPPPDPTHAAPTGAPVTHSRHWATSPLLLVFYPGDDTPVCTAQLCEYRDRWADFAKLGVAMFGINHQDHATHGAFTAKHRFPFPVLADPTGACCTAYGATSSFFGTKRLVVLIATGGRVAWRKQTFPLFRPKADELLAAVHALPPVH
jgi:peroxiredoxin Q/BCP